MILKHNIFKYLIFFGYNPTYPLMVTIYRGMLLYFILNIFFSFVYWYSYLHGASVDLRIFSINVNQETPVRYLAETFPRTLFVSLPVTILWIAGSAILERKKIAKSLAEAPLMPKNNLVRRVYTGEVKSFLWPTRNGYARLVIGGLFFECVVAAMIYVTIPAWYNKLYDGILYNWTADFRSQSTQTFFNWNFSILFLYQISATVLIIGLLTIFQILFQWPHIKRVSGILEYQKERENDCV